MATQLDGYMSKMKVFRVSRKGHQIVVALTFSPKTEFFGVCPPVRVSWHAVRVWVSYLLTSAVNALRPLPPPPPWLGIENRDQRLGVARRRVGGSSAPGLRPTCRVALPEVPARSPLLTAAYFTSTIRVPFLVHSRAYP